jgi:hypothetical protein
MQDEDEITPRKPYPPGPARMSKVPSWISVGFVIGALVGWTVREPKPAPPPQTRIVEVTRPDPHPIKISTVEAIFEEWRQFAAWRDDDTTEIEIFNTDTNQHDAYEVRRVDDRFYFRTLPRLTRKLIDYGDKLPPNAPIRFAGVEERPASRASRQMP